MIYIENAEGPMDDRVLKNPSPHRYPAKPTFNGLRGQVTPVLPSQERISRPLPDGIKKLKGQFSARLWVVLINADLGVFVSYLCLAMQPNQHRRRMWTYQQPGHIYS